MRTSTSTGSDNGYRACLARRTDAMHTTHKCGSGQVDGGSAAGVSVLFGGVVVVRAMWYG